MTPVTERSGSHAREHPTPLSPRSTGTRGGRAIETGSVRRKETARQKVRHAGKSKAHASEPEGERLVAVRCAASSATKPRKNDDSSLLCHDSQDRSELPIGIPDERPRLRPDSVWGAQRER